MAGGTAKLTALLSLPDTRTTILPVVAPFGTGRLTYVFDQVVTVPVVPLKVTVLVPWVAPKFDPNSVTDVPTPPDDGVWLEIHGVVITEKEIPLLATPPTVTTTLPVVALLGTVVSIRFPSQ
jgi:hypothetical protein